MMFKGQVISTDMLVAFVIFLFILDASVLLWGEKLAKAKQIEDERWLEDVARAASNQLLTPGDPADWEVSGSSLNSFGLTSSDNVIKWEKFERMEELAQEPESYYSVKRALGLECCEVWFGVTYSNGTVIKSFGEIPPKNKSVISIDRKALLNSSVVTVRIEVWR
ncbi:MAG: hypothetical protein QXF56_00195 [Candidatus Micrarchaeia archaeon]